MGCRGDIPAGGCMTVSVVLLLCTISCCCASCKRICLSCLPVCASALTPAGTSASMTCCICSRSTRRVHALWRRWWSLRTHGAPSAWRQQRQTHSGGALQYSCIHSLLDNSQTTQSKWVQRLHQPLPQISTQRKSYSTALMMHASSSLGSCVTQFLLLFLTFPGPRVACCGVTQAGGLAAVGGCSVRTLCAADALP